ncbi:MAG: hypothetical protein OEX81_02815 [Candidatus Pacebacteria bacterium]|nr:hypothetical protein [Candidatus Paceibacterota bacterium]
MSNKNKKKIVDLGVETGVGLAGAGAGFAIAGPIGALLGPAISPVVSDFLKRALTKREKDKIEKVAIMAIQSINEKISKGSKPKFDTKKKKDKAKELFEGVLLNARDTYEEKKLPLIANIFAVAPFTNSPVENLIQALSIAERLTYRQLCILTIVGNNGYANSPILSDKQFKEQHVDKAHDEFRDGIYYDILLMINQGILVQMESDFSHISGMVVIADIIPQRLRLYALGRLMFNAMMLDSIEEKDLTEIREILK